MLTTPRGAMRRNDTRGALSVKPVKPVDPWPSPRSEFRASPASLPPAARVRSRGHWVWIEMRAGRIRWTQNRHEIGDDADRGFIADRRVDHGVVDRAGGP